MKISQLTYILKVAETCSMSKAADELYVSKQNMAAAISALENELGVTIFNRTSKGMTITADGEKILSYAKEILAIYENMQQVSTVKQSLSLNISTHLANLYLPDIVTSFKASCPENKLSITADTDINHVLEQIYYGKLDACIMNLYDGQDFIFQKAKYRDNFNIELLLTDNILLVASKSLGMTKYSDLRNTSIPILNYEREINLQNMALAASLNIPTLTAPNTETYQALVESGMGIGTASSLLFHKQKLRYSDNINILENDLQNNPDIKILLVTHNNQKGNKGLTALRQNIKKIMHI